MNFNNFEFSLPITAGRFKKDHKPTEIEHVYIGSRVKPILISSVSAPKYLEKTWFIINNGGRFKITIIRKTKGNYYEYTWTERYYNGGE